MTTAEVWDVDHEAYHQDRSAISHSAKECFRRSQKAYHAIYVTGILQPQEPSEAMQIGSLLHLAVLEPDRFLNEAIMAPSVDRRTKIGKEQWTAFQEIANGKQIVAADMYDLVMRMAVAVKSHPIANRLLSRPGVCEQAIVWTCERTGLRLKSLRDFVSGDLIVDLKTARDSSPEAFAKAAAALGYHRQMAHYLDGHETLTGEPASFVFVVVENRPPHTVAVYELDEAAFSLGDTQNHETLQRMKRCMDSGDWAAAHERAIMQLSLPKWTFYDDWSLNEQ